MDTDSLLKVSLQLGKSDYFKSSDVGLNIALPCLKGPQSERNEQLIIKLELWLSALNCITSANGPEAETKRTRKHPCLLQKKHIY